jgi:hypothetical protein
MSLDQVVGVAGGLAVTLHEHLALGVLQHQPSRGALGMDQGHQLLAGRRDDAVGVATAPGAAGAPRQRDGLKRHRVGRPPRAISEAVDHQTTEGHIGLNGQHVGAPGRWAGECDQRRAGVARLGGAIDQDGLGDRRQRRARRDRPDALAGEGKVDRVPGAGGGVGIEDGLAERAGAAVAGIGHREAAQQRPVLHDFEAGSEPEQRPAHRGLPYDRPTAARPIQEPQ